MIYVLYLPESGRIVQYGSCESMKDVPSQEGCKVLTLKEAFSTPLDQCYVQGGVLKPFPSKPGYLHVFDYVQKNWILPENVAWNEVRKLRNMELQQTDWTQLPDVPESTRLVWQTYRQALRDITKQPDPQTIQWPQKPA